MEFNEQQLDEDEGFYIGVCTECHSDQPGKYMENSPFDEPPCKMCGGVVMIIPARANRDQALATKDQERGITPPRRSN